LTIRYFIQSPVSACAVPVLSCQLSASPENANSSSSSSQAFNGAHKDWKAYQKRVLEEIEMLELRAKKPLQAGTLIKVVFKHLEADSEPLRVAETLQSIFADNTVFDQAVIVRQG